MCLPSFFLVNTKAVTFLAFTNFATIIGGVIAPYVVKVAVYHFVFTSGGKMIGAVITKVYLFRFVNVNWYVLVFFLCIFVTADNYLMHSL